MINYYEKRYISKTNKNSVEIFFDAKNNSKTLKEYIFEFDKIILLGNPGIGKTKELEKLFDDLWVEKEENGLIPFLINLKNFRKANKFEDLISYKDWIRLPNIIFILDGLDEIAEITDFLSAFEIFISQNKSSNIKYVLSCRTNIYNKYLINISDFETFYLENLTIEQDKSILKNEYEINIEKIAFNGKYLDFLKTPFFLKLFAECYNEHNRLPTSEAEIWELYINKTIEQHQIKQIKKNIINKPLLIKELKKTAFVNELMQKNYVTEDELFQIIGKDYLDFIDNPFLNTMKNNAKKWNFEHRQIQEYFVAKTLNEKSYDEIISIIKIPTLNSIQPSLFNTITFLINVIDKDSAKYRQLLDWILINQIELLFRADSDRITKKLRTEVFQKYFETECINKTFWISSNKTFSEKEIAEFADCKENHEYLLKIIKENKHHFRVIISAIRLIKYFNTSKTSTTLKSEIITLLAVPSIDVKIKSQLIECIEALEFCKNDPIYLANIFKIFENESNKEINRQLLSLLNQCDDIDNYYEYLKIEFQRENGIIVRAEPDNVYRGGNWIIESLILKLKDPDKYLDIISFYFKDGKHLDLSQEFSDKILASCMLFSKQVPDFIKKLLISINTNYRRNDALLKKIIIDCAAQIEATEFIIDNRLFSDVSFLLADIATHETISLIIEKYQEKKIINNEYIEVFRNILGNTNKRELAKEFNSKMLNAGYLFKEPLFSDEELVEEQQKYKHKPQINFDILFNKEELLGQIKNIFDEINATIGIDEIIIIENDWYTKNGHWNTLIDTSINILHTIVYNNNNQPIDFKKVNDLIVDGSIIYKKIQDAIIRNETSNNKFNITKDQEVTITNWCLLKSKTISFDNIIKVKDSRSFTLYKDYESFNLVMFFYEQFDFELNADFLLKSIEFYGTEDYNDDSDTKMELLFKKINSKILFDKQIIENINSKQLLFTTFKKHVKYAIENELKDSFSKIRTFILNESDSYIEEKILEKYITSSGDFNLLKELSADIDTNNCWTAMSILVKNNKEEELCISKSIDYLNQKESVIFSSNALGILFHYNKPEALEYFYKLINEDITPYFNGTAYANYTIENYELLEKLFIAIYVDGEEKFKFGNHFTFYNIYVSNLSKDDDSYKKTQEVLNKIRKDLETGTSDSGKFYINQQIDNSTNSYINSKSKPLSFKEALAKVEEIIK